MSWLGKKNGELLKLIAGNQFDYFITIDKNLRHQHNLQQIPFIFCVLMASNNRYETLQSLFKNLN